MATTTKILYRLHGGSKVDGETAFRVWNSSWQGDQFELVGETKWKTIGDVCVTYNIPFEQAPEDDEA